MSDDFLAHLFVKDYIHLLQQHLVCAFINKYIKRKSLSKKSTHTVCLIRKFKMNSTGEKKSFAICGLSLNT